MGIVTEVVPHMLVMEYMENQSLHDMLHTSGILFGVDTLLSMLRDVVEGMVFLHEYNPMIVHGHLSSYVRGLALLTLLSLPPSLPLRHVERRRTTGSRTCNAGA